MGVQPATLQSGLVAATAVDRHHRARPRRSPRRPAARPSAPAAHGHDHRHGHRRRRRRRRRRRGLDRRRHHLAPGHRPRRPGPTPGRRAPPARRRSRAAPSTTAATSRTPAPASRHVDSRCPCSLWNDTAIADATAQNDASAGRARHQVPLRRRRLDHRPPLLQGRRQHRHARRPPLDVAPARCWPAATFTNETASGWQQVELRHPGRDHAPTRPTSPPTSRRRPLRRQRRLLRSTGGDNAPLHALADRRPSGNGVYQYGARRLPDRHVQRDQLLGRRRLRHRAGRTPLRRPSAVVSPADGATGVATDVGRHRDVQRVDRTPPSLHLHARTRGRAASLVPATVTYNGATSTATLTPRARSPSTLTRYTVGRHHRGRQGRRGQHHGRHLLVVHHGRRTGQARSASGNDSTGRSSRPTPTPTPSRSA